MKLTILLIASICMLSTACKEPQNDAKTSSESHQPTPSWDLPDSLSTRRISFVLDLKNAVAKSHWPEFGAKANEGTLIYFEGDRSEVFFPDVHVREKLDDYQEHNDHYWLTRRTDSLPYHMEVMISFNDEDSAAFFYKNPVEQYSSVEEIGQYIPSVESTEMWATMVVHEMFHHFQYNTENFGRYAESVIGILPFDSRNMTSLCREDEQFLPMIQAENETLMEAIAAEDKSQRDALISVYLGQREQRMGMYSPDHPHLEQVENYYIIQEGSARYIEYHSMHIFREYLKLSDAPTIPNDPMFRAYLEFEEIDFESDAFNYLVYAGPTDYHYTLGFNIMRLLDELEFEYKKDLLNHPEKGLHEYLEDYLASK